MQHPACSRADILDAFEDLSKRLDERVIAFWNAYLEATTSMTRREYAECEHESWAVLTAALSGIAAERRMLERGVEERLSRFDAAMEAIA